MSVCFSSNNRSQECRSAANQLINAIDLINEVRKMERNYFIYVPMMLYESMPLFMIYGIPNRRGKYFPKLCADMNYNTNDVESWVFQFVNERIF